MPFFLQALEGGRIHLVLMPCRRDSFGIRRDSRPRLTVTQPHQRDLVSPNQVRCLSLSIGLLLSRVLLLGYHFLLVSCGEAVARL